MSEIEPTVADMKSVEHSVDIRFISGLTAKDRKYRIYFKFDHGYPCSAADTFSLLLEIGHLADAIYHWSGTVAGNDQFTALDQVVATIARPFIDGESLQNGQEPHYSTLAIDPKYFLSLEIIKWIDQSNFGVRQALQNVEPLGVRIFMHQSDTMYRRHMNVLTEFQKDLRGNYKRPGGEDVLCNDLMRLNHIFMVRTASPKSVFV